MYCRVCNSTDIVHAGRSVNEAFCFMFPDTGASIIKGAGGAFVVACFLAVDVGSTDPACRLEQRARASVRILTR